jgi:hypothetical protein
MAARVAHLVIKIITQSHPVQVLLLLLARLAVMLATIKI